MKRPKGTLHTAHVKDADKVQLKMVHKKHGSVKLISAIVRQQDIVCFHGHA